jgi:hypothetical protein
MITHEPLDLEMEITQDGLSFVIKANGSTWLLDKEQDGKWSLGGAGFETTFSTRKPKKFALLKAIDLVLGHLANDNLMVEVEASKDG